MTFITQIPNHIAARLSALDLEMAVSVPPGGNWKDIPTTIPSKRLDSIRSSYALGGGSRSTYYGRLHPERPAYTINTYYNRPGNGCHLHYDYDGGQHRVLSEREAARLQSFPDNFIFKGSHTSIQKQIGNAVPPLLAFQVARTLPFKCQYVDLFSGAGGLSQGLQWAGWEPIVANDIEYSYLATYESNVHKQTVCGDIRDKNIFDSIVEITARDRRPDKPLFIVGGPPCQGFSTAGNRRSVNDERNQLFSEFKRLISVIRPNGFIFENVMGLTSMDKGRAFETIKKELTLRENRLLTWILKAEEYGVPQRRTRLMLISIPKTWPDFQIPRKITSFPFDDQIGNDLAPAISVHEALSDLPVLFSGEDGSSKAYNIEANGRYQPFMRGLILPFEYVQNLENEGRKNDTRL